MKCLTTQRIKPHHKPRPTSSNQSKLQVSELLSLERVLIAEGLELPPAAPLAAACDALDGMVVRLTEVEAARLALLAKELERVDWGVLESRLRHRGGRSRLLGCCGAF